MVWSSVDHRSSSLVVSFDRGLLVPRYQKVTKEASDTWEKASDKGHIVNIGYHVTKYLDNHRTKAYVRIKDLGPRLVRES